MLVLSDCSLHCALVPSPIITWRRVCVWPLESEGAAAYFGATRSDAHTVART